MTKPDIRLPTLCPHCGELFWSSAPPEGLMVACPECTVAVAAPAGRFAGIRNLVEWVASMPEEQRGQLEEWLSWQESRPRDAPPDESFDPVRRRLADLDLGTSLFWRQCLIFAVQEVVARPSFTASETAVTELARAVAQRALTIRSYEPRAY